MAPGLSNVVVFDAGPNRVIWNDILNAMAAQSANQTIQFALGARSPKRDQR